MTRSAKADEEVVEMGITSKDVNALSHTAFVSDAARHGVRLFAERRQP